MRIVRSSFSAYPFLPAFYILVASLVMLGQICLSPKFSGAGLLIILSGLPAFMIWNKLNAKLDSSGTNTTTD